LVTGENHGDFSKFFMVKSTVHIHVCHPTEVIEMEPKQAKRWDDMGSCIFILYIGGFLK
jgi:hypothetical protein